jgi:hypothetical protein
MSFRSQARNLRVHDLQIYDSVALFHPSYRHGSFQGASLALFYLGPATCRSEDEYEANRDLGG